jgi:hypothetical protein
MYTAIELAVLKAKGEIEAAKELVSLPRADLAIICQHFKLKVSRKADTLDIVGAILALTHPKEQLTAPTAPAEQMRMF